MLVSVAQRGSSSTGVSTTHAEGRVGAFSDACYRRPAVGRRRIVERRYPMTRPPGAHVRGRGKSDIASPVAQGAGRRLENITSWTTER